MSCGTRRPKDRLPRLRSWSTFYAGGAGIAPCTGTSERRRTTVNGGIDITEGEWGCGRRHLIERIVGLLQCLGIGLVAVQIAGNDACCGIVVGGVRGTLAGGHDGIVER